MGSIILAKVQPVMRICSIVIFLLLIFLTLSNHRVIAQCPENVHLDKNNGGDTGDAVLLVFDDAGSSINISQFEINIYNELTGNYLVTESNIIPSIGNGATAEVSKSGNRILIGDKDPNIDLTKCLVIFVGNNCTLKKIRIKDN